MSTTALSLPQARSFKLNYVQSLFQWDSLLFAIICVADMCTTLYWVHIGAAKEANPMLARCLQQGDGMFIFTKVLSFFPMLCLCAWYRMKQPKFVAQALRIALIAYITIYAVGVGSEFIR